MRSERMQNSSNYPKTLSSPGFYEGYTPFSDSYLDRDPLDDIPRDLAPLPGGHDHQILILGQDATDVVQRRHQSEVTPV